MNSENMQKKDDRPVIGLFPSVTLNISVMKAREHYENTPMQYTAIFQGCKNVHFQMIFFSYFCQNIDCGYTLEPPQ